MKIIIIIFQKGNLVGKTESYLKKTMKPGQHKAQEENTTHVMSKQHTQLYPGSKKQSKRNREITSDIKGCQSEMGSHLNVEARRPSFVSVTNKMTQKTCVVAFKR